MAFNRKHLPRDLATGFGSKSSDNSGRYYKKDGSVNIIRKGVPFFDQFSWFHTWLSMSRWKFWLSLIIAYILLNIFFALIYYAIGLEHLTGLERGTHVRNFAEAFFFSAQTFTTVGYGRVSPVGFLASTVATLEAFLGLLGFALASGLFYGRFAKPRPHLYFSGIALLSPYKDGKALMFRTVPFKNNHLTDAEVKLTLGIRSFENGEWKNDFFPLKVEFSKINSLVMNWTIVHPINEESPMYGLTLDQLKEAKAEVLVLLKAYDEVFATNVVARTSYTAHEFIENAKFKIMYEPSSNGDATILNVDRLNDFELLDLKR
jgi:inward rectifier potassium channel